MINAFIGGESAPTDAELAAELGSAIGLWDLLRRDIQLPGEWHSYSKKSGWAMRLKRGDRNILYLVPGRGAFEVALTLGDRAVAAARDRGLAKMVDGAKRYAEGTAIRFAINGPLDIAAAKKLVEIKLEF
jgi:hypothetical protein